MKRLTVCIVFSIYCMSSLPLYAATEPQEEVAQQVATPQKAFAPGGFPQQPMAGQPGMPPMSEQELLQWQQEVDAEIAKFVSTLPPEEQEQFHKDVAELTQVMENMSEDELLAFIDNLFPPEEGAAMPAIAPKPEQPQIIEQEEIKVEETKPSKNLEAERVAAEKQENAIKLLTNLITRTERFLRKSAMIPELAGKIEQWVAADKVKEWQVGLTWNTLKAEIEALDQKFHDIKDSIDPKTKKYRYLDDLIADEALYNNLAKLSTSLTRFEPKIEIPDSATKAVNKTTRDAIKEVLGAFAEAVYTTDIKNQLLKLTEKYEPRAKELREEEEAATKRAFEESKKPRKEQPKKEAASPKKYRPAAQATSPEFYGGYQVPSYGSYGAYDRGANQYDYQPQELEFGGPAEQAAGGARGGGKAGAVKEADHGKKAPEAKKPEEKPKGEEKAQEDANSKRLVKKIETSLDKVQTAIDNNAAFTNLDAHVSSAEPVKPALARDIITATRNLKKANDDLKALTLGFTKLKPDQQKMYKREVKGILDDFKDSFVDLKKNIDTIKKKQSTLSNVKRYAYFGENQQQALTADPTLAQTLEQPANLDALARELDNLKKNTEKLK